jgi:hypothetical protein
MSRYGACKTGSDIANRFLDLDLVWLAGGILRLSLTVSKLCDFFAYRRKCPLKIFEEGIVSKEKRFSSMRP